jgi:hypothetical protein
MDLTAKALEPQILSTALPSVASLRMTPAFDRVDRLFRNDAFVGAMRKRERRTCFVRRSLYAFAIT